MPELPEVETTARGIAPWVEGRRISKVTVRQRALRWPVPVSLAQCLTGLEIEHVGRRGKYLLLRTRAGHLMIHLGMSGSLRIASEGEALKKHDHLDIALSGGSILRFHDPRRFGSVHWLEGDPLQHPLLSELGPEPLSDAFTADYLFARSRRKQVAIKTFIMDSHVVVGVGNIYANEALFRAGILPTRKAGSVSRQRYALLVEAIREVLAQAIASGGTTLRDFVGGDGKPGYFVQELSVYGRAGEACKQCGAALTEVRLGQRATVYCRRCQR